MTTAAILATPTSPPLTPPSKRRKLRILSDSDDSDKAIEQSNAIVTPSGNSSAGKMKRRIVKRRQPIQHTPKKDAAVEHIDKTKSDTDLAKDYDSVTRSPSNDPTTNTTRRRPRIHNCTWPHCGKIYDNKTKLSEHIRTHTGERPYVCPVEECGKSYMKNGQLQVHARTHDDNAKTAFRCTVDGCGATFAAKHRLKNHQKLHERPLDFVCDWEGCDAAFAKPFQLRNHMCTHTNKKPYPCTQEGCESSFDTRPKLDVHVAAVHNTELRYLCGHEGCNAKFAKYSELQHHTKYDHEHKCSICGKVYETRGNLTYHVNTVHLQQDPFVCHWDGCGKEFKMQSSLRFHIRNIHQNIKPHKCEYDGCDIAFPTPSALRRHIKNRHEPKEDQGTIPTAADLSVLTGYSENGNNKQRSYNCPFDGCGMTFWREYDLKRHIESKVHESDLSQEVQNVDAS